MRLKLYTYVFVVLCLTTFPVLAQETKPQELLYRSGDTLYLADITTGTTTDLPDIKASSSNWWYWSPDGHYLAGDFTQSQGEEKLIRIYDIDNRHWIQNIYVDTYSPVIVWSQNSTQIAYVKSIRSKSINRDELWVYDLNTGNPRVLYQTKNITGNTVTDTGVWGIWWSPDDQFLIFDEVFSTRAYPIPNLRLISADGKTFDELNSPFSGNSTDTPIWSPDSKWFLVSQWETAYEAINLKASRDLILYGIDGQIYRLTYSPDVQKYNERWSADGKEIYFETDTQFITINWQSVLNFSFDHPTTIEQTVSPLPPKRQPVGEAGEEILSPDGKWLVFVIHKVNKLSDLVIARPDGSQNHSLADDVTFLGWRPS